MESIIVDERIKEKIFGRSQSVTDVHAGYPVRGLDNQSSKGKNINNSGECTYGYDVMNFH